MVLSHRIERSSLEVGDHIYAWRIAYTYSHHGIYIGDDKVIHFIPHGVVSTSVDEFLSFLILGFSKLRRYKYSSKRTSFVLKQRGTCTTAASDDADTVVHRAKELLKNGFGSYDLGKRNCENFAVYCKTGLRVVNGGGGEDIAGLCGQVAAVKCKAVVVTTVAGPVVLMGAAVASTGPVGVVVAAVAFTAFAAADLVAPTAFTVVAGGVLYYCKRRLDKDIGIRKDVIKKADVASASDAASPSPSPSSEEKEQEEDYRNWTAEQMDHGAAMEAYIPSTSLQILSDLSKHCVPGYCPDAVLIPPHIKN